VSHQTTPLNGQTGDDATSTTRDSVITEKEATTHQINELQL
jgi:hypothetical protein